jgi:hypothetical protein
LTTKRVSRIRFLDQPEAQTFATVLTVIAADERRLVTSRLGFRYRNTPGPTEIAMAELRAQANG